MHAIATPRLGGLAMYAGVCAAFLVAGSLPALSRVFTYSDVQATVVADRWGTASYGALAGWFAAPITAAAALAPWAGTALATATGSHPAAFGLLAGITGAGVAAAALGSRG